MTTSNAFQLCKLWASEKVPGMCPVTSCLYSLYILSSLARSRDFSSVGAPLAIDDSVDDCKAYDAVTEPLFQQIISFSQRWKHVELPMPFSIYKKLETFISMNVLSLLYSLRGGLPWGNIGLADPDSFRFVFWKRSMSKDCHSIHESISVK